MTLYRQLILIVTALCVLMFAGTVLVNLYSTQKYLLQQLRSHAEDTASSLGLSLSPHMAANDMAMISSMIDAIYDRGYYSVVKLVTIDGETVIEREAQETLEGIPNWFIKLVPLKTPEAGAHVMSGWNLAAVVYVRSHPGYAYRQLWRSSTQMLFWFVAVAFAIGIVGAIGIHALLKPLRTLEKQAEGICDRKYEIQEALPRTRELQQVVLAMNRMTQRVKAMFEEQALSAERMQGFAYQDNLTGLGNRRYFDSRLGATMRATDGMHKGTLMLVHIVGLGDVNNTHGFEAGDKLIAAAAELLRECTDGTGAIIGRRSGSDFALLFPGMDEGRAAELAQVLTTRLAELHTRSLTPSANVLTVGMSSYTGTKAVSDLLAEADEALRIAQSHGINQWCAHQATTPGIPSPGRQEWAKRIAEVVERREIVLHAQPVVAAGDAQRLLHREVLVRIPAANGQLWTAETFMPLAEEWNMARSIDRVVVESLLDHMLQQRNREPYAINLSPGCLRDENFLNWLYKRLDKLPRECGKLVFEMPEYGAVQDLERLREFSTHIRAAGHGLGLDHFGQGFSTFGYLQSLRPDYVKLDGAYTVHLDTDRDDQFFVQALSGIARSLEILTIAEMVETDNQWRILSKLQLDGVQGYAVGRPKSIGEA